MPPLEGPTLELRTADGVRPPDERRASNLVGSVLDSKYLVERSLGEGGMGAVFLARHLGTERPVALKVIAQHLVTSAEAMDRFRAEAIAAGRLRHPNVVDVTDFGVAALDDRRVAYLVMELLDGQSLASLLAVERRLPLSFTVDVLEQVCSAMEEAHNHGIVHRDLKPENVWLEPNRRGGYTVKTLDFGIAKLLDRVTTAPAPPASAELPTLPLPRAELRAGAPGPITRADTIIGTPHYMSPEQWRGEDLDGRADIYSLGVLAYRMLSGRMPFDGSPAELMRQHLYQQASPRPLLERRVPPAAADLVLRCLAKTPGERPRSAEELAAALRARAEGLGAVMRRVLAMGSEHSPSFLQISTIAHVPAMVALVFALGLSILSATLDPPPALRTAMVVVPCALFFLTGLFATSFSTGVFVPVLARLSARPLAAVPIMPLILLLRPLRYRLMRAALLFYAAALPSKLLLLVPLVLLRGAPAPWLLVPLLLLASAAGMWNTVRYALHAHAVVVEGLAGRAALRRSAELVSRAGKNIRGATALFASIVVFDLMALATCVVIVRSLDHGVALAIAQGSLLILPILAGVVLFVVTSILANPLLGLSFAMVYLRTRQSDGEALDRILGDRFLR